MQKILFSRFSKRAILFVLALTYSVVSFAQGGAQGIDAGTSELATYVDPVGNLILAIGAIVGIIGGVRVYIKWNTGDNDVQKSIMGWMGSCIFLMLVGTVIKAFFGL